MEKSEAPFETWRGYGSPARGADGPDDKRATGNRGAGWRRLLDEQVTGPGSGAAVRAYIDLGRQRLLESHRAGTPGADVVRAHGGMIDCLLQRLFEMAEEDCAAALKGRCAVVAQGGYGRDELNPYSDIDILFLYGWRAAPYVEFITEKILYPLWDAGLTVGHATRTVTECARHARRDHVIQTALVDARYICGDVRLHGDLERLAWRQLGGGACDRFVEMKMTEYEQRPAARRVGLPAGAGHQGGPGGLARHPHRHVDRPGQVRRRQAPGSAGNGLAGARGRGGSGARAGFSLAYPKRAASSWRDGIRIG